MAWMKNKSNGQPNARDPKPAAPAAEVAARSSLKHGKVAARQVSIGSSMHIKGEVTGGEDLIIDGRVEGKIILTGHHLTIGKNGHVTAEIHDVGAVVVEGQLVGDISAGDRIEIGATGSIVGDINAPRVILADGARFKGSVDMEPKSAGPSTPARATSRN